MRKRDAAGGSTTTRRQVLGGALAIAGWTMTTWAWRANAQPAGCGTDSGPLVPLGEVRSEGGKLRAIMATRSKVWQTGDEGAGQPVGERALRYFEATDPSGNPIWPPADCKRPMPGPTLRARVGERVEITFLNHIDVNDFGKTGIDRGEQFPPGDIRGCDVLFSGKDPGNILYPGRTGDDAPNCFHGSSTTNIHFHGTHVTPDGLGDNVLLQLRPNLTVTEPSVRDDFQKIFDSGPPAKWKDLPESWRTHQEMLLQQYDKNADLPPENRLWPPTKERIDAGLWPQYQIGAYPFCYDLTKYTEGGPYRMGQCPGTHWYHAHKHGSTAINVMNGMVGAFVIEGDYDDAFAKIYPNLRETEKVLVLHDVADTPNMARGNIPLKIAFASPSLHVNGQLNPTISMRPGEIQLWRLVNATVKTVTTVTGFTSATGTPLPDIRQTAQDGVQFSWDNFAEQPILNFLKSAPPDAKARPSSFAPGNRIDFLVKAPTTSGDYTFVLSDTAQFGDPDPVTVPINVLTLRVEGSAVSMDFPTRENYPAFPPFLKDITHADTQPSPTNPAKVRTLEFGWNDRNKKLPGANLTSGKAPGFVINDKKFSGKKYDQEMVLGAVEEWTLKNSTAEIAHPFHIHINPFQVVEIFDPVAGTSYKPSGNYVWQDVIAIPPATFNGDGTVKEMGRVTIRHRFVDFVGSYVLHCHMLAHEDRGMMELVQVVPTKADLGKTDKPMPQHH